VSARRAVRAARHCAATVDALPVRTHHPQRIASTRERRGTEDTMTIPVGLNVWSRLVTDVIPYLDQIAGA
jgi:hypothetical protein